jgi:hypothetical protein
MGVPEMADGAGDGPFGFHRESPIFLPRDFVYFSNIHVIDPSPRPASILKLESSSALEVDFRKLVSADRLGQPIVDDVLIPEVE